MYWRDAVAHIHNAITYAPKIVAPAPDMAAAFDPFYARGPVYAPEPALHAVRSGSHTMCINLAFDSDSVAREAMIYRCVPVTP